jgi:MYXO-CTERM domain-containing protein
MNWVFRVWSAVVLPFSFNSENSMKIILAVALTLITVVPSLAQTESRPNDVQQHNYGWVGLLGLAGLAGLRRQKGVEHKRMEAAGINVKSVKV